MRVPENELDVPSEKTYSILRKKKEERMEGGSTEIRNLESAPSKETRQKEQCNRKRVSGLDQDKLINQAKEKDWDWEEEMEEEDGGGLPRLLHIHKTKF